MKKILFTVMAVVLSLGLMGGAFAYFSDTETSIDNTFTSGTLLIDGPGVTEFSFSDYGNMAPGDMTGEAVLTIKNVGTLPLFWFGDWVITGADTLNKAIYIDYAKMEFLKPDGILTWEPADNFITNGVGSGPYPDWYNTLAGLNAFGLVGLDVWDDNNGMGTTPYEHVGALEPGYSYRLTVKLGFAAAAENDYQDLGPLTVSITVDAIQANIDQLTTFGYPAMWTWLNAQLAKQ